MTREGTYYFGAGPAPLPTPVVEQAAHEFVEYEDLGVGLGELSHRSAQATAIVDTTKAEIRELLNVPETHEILFVQGGGTGGFAAAVYTMISHYYKTTGNASGIANYVVSGSWSAKAKAEAERLGVESHVVATSKDESGKYVSLPEQSAWKPVSENAAFLYYCDNETVDGIEFSSVPDVSVPLVCDISSNMLSRPIDVSKFGILFGGAQKNVGIAGVSLYIVRKSILEQLSTPQELKKAGLPIAPSVLDLSLVAKNNSAYNTVSIFAIECVKLVCARLAKIGIEGQEKISNSKAAKLYAVVDARKDVYHTRVHPASRSRMNIVFNLSTPEAEAKFLKGAAALNLTGLKGHRSVGGIRVSNYNAVEPEAVDKLVDYMKSFNP